MPCSPFKMFRRSYCLHLHPQRLCLPPDFTMVGLFFDSDNVGDVPPKRRLTFNGRYTTVCETWWGTCSMFCNSEIQLHLLRSDWRDDLNLPSRPEKKLSGSCKSHGSHSLFFSATFVRNVISSDKHLECYCWDTRRIADIHIKCHSLSSNLNQNWYVPTNCSQLLSIKHSMLLLIKIYFVVDNNAKYTNPCHNSAHDKRSIPLHPFLKLCVAFVCFLI
jgi:hypothetical protein